MAPLRIAIPSNHPTEAVPAIQDRQTRPRVPLHDRLAVSIPELAELLGTSVPTVRQMLRDGLPHIRPSAAGHRVLIPVECARRHIVERAVSLPLATDQHEVEEVAK